MDEAVAEAEAYFRLSMREREIQDRAFLLLRDQWGHSNINYSAVWRKLLPQQRAKLIERATRIVDQMHADVRRVTGIDDPPTEKPSTSL